MNDFGLHRFFVLILCIILPLSIFSQTPDANYVLTETMLDADGTRKITSVQYYDGLGCPTLTIQDGINGNSCTTNYVLKEYDGNGREYRTWQPISGSSLDYDGNITNKAVDAMAYSQTSYDALDRAMFISTPGSDMNGKGRTIEYTTNPQGSVKQYVASENGVQQSGYCLANTLQGEKTTDEDGHTVETFKDFFGNVVLERRNETNDTYYVYDGVQHLRYVLSPMYQENDDLNKYAYQYTYDDYGRIQTKKLPGCGTCRYSYDSAGRMISSKDGNGIIRFYLYDALGRLAVQGRCGSMQPYNMPYSNTSLTSDSGVLGTGYSQPIGYMLTGAVLEIANYYDNYAVLENTAIITDGTIRLALTNGSPVCATGFLTAQTQRASDGTLLHSAYYYDIRGNVTDRRETMPDGVVMKTETTYSFTNKPTSVTTSLMAGGKAYTVMETNEYCPSSGKLKKTFVGYGDNVPTVLYSHSYDNYGRISEKSAQNSLTTTYGYDLRGRLTALTNFFESDIVFGEQLTYNDRYFNGNINSIAYSTFNDDTDARNHYEYEFEYDGLDRLTAADYHSMNENDDSDYSEYSAYNANGAPVSMQRYGRKSNGQYGVIDNLQYTYDGNQVTSIKDNSGISLSYANSFEFRDGADSAVEYTYDDNGNMTRNLNSGIGLVEYDELNRPRRIQFTGGHNIQYVYAADGRKLKTIHQTAIDNLPAVTAGAKLDLTPATLKSQTVTYYMGGFQIRNGVLDRYQLPSGDGYIAFNNSRQVQVKDKKTGKTYTTWQTVTSSETLLNPNYRVAQANEPYYYIKDHLGSNVMIADNYNTLINYYPSGGHWFDEGNRLFGTAPRYTYNGKEHDKSFGFNMIDYGARMYDPTMAMWTQVDPMAEKYYGISPYVYCAGNSINSIDPDGREKLNWLNLSSPANMNQSLEYKRFNDDKNTINIWAHGNELGLTLSYMKGGSWIERRITNAKDMVEVLKQTSVLWKEHVEKGKDITIVLHSCSTSEFAESLSGNELFKDVTIIAPDKDLYVITGKGTHSFYKNGYDIRTGIGLYKGSVVGNRIFRNEDGKIVGNGKWNAFVNGQLKKSLSGFFSPDYLPGASRFSYNLLCK